MATGPGLAPHRPGTSGQAPVAEQAGSSTPGSLAVVLCWCLKEPAAVAAEGPAHAWQSRAGPCKTYSTKRPTTRAEAPVQPGPIGPVGITRLVNGEIKQNAYTEPTTCHS